MQHRCSRGSARKDRWIRNLQSSGVQPELVILEEAPENEVSDAEAAWIERGQQRGWALLNENGGGGGKCGTAIYTMPEQAPRDWNGYLTVPEASKAYGVPYQTLYGAFRYSRIPGVKIGTGVYLEHDAVRKYVEARTAKGGRQ